MKIYYSKEPIEIGNATGDPIPADSTVEPCFKIPTDRVLYPKPVIKDGDFRSGKERRRERRMLERKELLKRNRK